jgi:aldehyde dehydrogenase (NAD+)
MQSRLQQYIDGQWVDSEGGRTHQVINPATEQPVTEVTLGSAADVDKAVAAARRAFDTFSQTSVAERAQLLERTIEAYKARIPDLAKAVSEEMGAPIGFAQAAQVPAGLGYFMSTLKALGEFQWEERIGKARVVHEPIGVVAMITPWNWPLNQICAKVAPALAAGDTMILKPSEECPSCAMILAEILDAAGVPAGVFNLINGDGPGVGAALSGHRGVDMVSFTGSTRAGIAVAQAAAPTVKRVHQELGGKAPNLVLEGADLAQVLPPTVQGVLANTGQSCIAPTRILVHRTSSSRRPRSSVRSCRPPPWAIRPRWARISAGREPGAVRQDPGADPVGDRRGRDADRGGPGKPDGRNAGYYVKPTVLAGVTPEMRIWREETFGPVATITSYDSAEQAIQLANDTDYGLSATISGDPAKASEVASKLRAGLVSINSWTGGNGTPFGGYKQSGNGREGGKFGIADFLEVKTIIGEAA